jgi:hypothetical protein
MNTDKTKNKPIWLCETKEHKNCQCGNNLREQLQAWREEIATEHPDLRHRVLKCYIKDYPVEPCPYCGHPCEADMVDIGVGLTQCSPFYCERCKASEIGPERVELSYLEEITGWYEPGKPVSPVANAFQGVLVNHKDAKILHEAGMLDSKKLIGGAHNAKVQIVENK